MAEGGGGVSGRDVLLRGGAVLAVSVLVLVVLVAVGVLPRHVVGFAARPQVLQGPDSVRVLATGPVTRSGLEGHLVGVVDVIDGCLGVRTPDEASSVVVAWPRGSKPLDDESGVRLAGGQTVLVGDALEAGGGLEDLGEAVPADTCGAQDRAWVLGDLTLG